MTLELHNLKPAEGSVKKRKRIGRGQGSTRGGTSTRGHKGAKSRSGYKRKRGFEGGQMPLQRRVPKRGFKNINRVEYVVMSLAKLEHYAEKFEVNEISTTWLYENRLIGKRDKVKVLANGEISKALKVSVNAYSEKAKSAIEAAGGEATIV